MGEHVQEEVFAVRDLTVQFEGGGFASFVRSIRNILIPLERFFRRTGNQYRRFNYLGEWHSHPSFSTQPSCRDLETVRDIVEDEGVGANFAILMILRLDGEKVQASATAISRGRPAEPVEIEFQEEERNEL